MKKFLSVLFVLLTITSLTVTAEENESYNPNRPEWKDFCPFGFENAKMDEKFHFWGTQNRTKAEEGNYWVKRKQDFDKELGFCDELSNDDKNACFGKLVARQIKYNEQHEIDRQNAIQKALNNRAAAMQGAASGFQAGREQSYQNRMLRMQEANMMMQNQVKWSDTMPKTYNVNVRHY